MALKKELKQKKHYKLTTKQVKNPVGYFRLLSALNIVSMQPGMQGYCFTV